MFRLLQSLKSVRPITGTTLVIGALAAALIQTPQSAYAQVSVTTQHYDNLRTGANRNETTLTPANVSGLQKLFTVALDANVNGQVLYMPNLTIKGAAHNVIFAYTSNNSNGSNCSVYAFDADIAGPALWHLTLPKAAQWTTATPVIDPVAGIIYVITKETGTYIQSGKDRGDGGPTKLHAIDLLTGVEKPGSPVNLAASIFGRGDGSVSRTLSFVSAQLNERPGLLLVNGNVYCAFAHNSDSFPYQGWIMGYHYDGTRFTRTGVFSTARNGGDAGVWMAGMGMTADDAGNIYTTVGNGTCTVFAGGSSYAMCIVKLETPDLIVTDWFAPFDELSNSNRDLDLGNVGVIGIPGTDRLFTGASKSGSGYLVDSNDLGGFTPGGPDRIIQRFNNMCSNSNVGQNPVCWDAGAAKYVYVWPNNTEIGQFRYDPTIGEFSLSPTTANPIGYNSMTTNIKSGGSMTVSANGDSTGILWAIGNDKVVRALDATDLTKPVLWSQSIPSVGHFQFPTVVNGKLYVPTGSATIVVYGLP